MKDNIVDRVINLFRKRSDLGIRKYGTTLHGNDKDDFLQHLKEELMDATLYIEKLQSERAKKYSIPEEDYTYIYKEDK